MAQTFTELNLSQPTQFRFMAPGVTQNIVKNPNSVLQDALQSSLQGTTMKSRTFLHVATNPSIIKAGGGTANTAFLATSGNPPGGNAEATRPRRRSGSRRSPGPGASQTSTSCSTRSW